MASPRDDPLPEAISLVRGAADSGHRLKIACSAASESECCALTSRPGCGRARTSTSPAWARPAGRSRITSKPRAASPTAGSTTSTGTGRCTSPPRPDARSTSWWTGCPCATRWICGHRSAPRRRPSTRLTCCCPSCRSSSCNAKDAHDIFHLLSGLRIGRDCAPGPAIDPDRFGAVLSSDWGWWRTVTGNLAKLPDLLSSQPHLAPPYPGSTPLPRPSSCKRSPTRCPRELSGNCEPTWATGSAGTNCPRK